MFRPLALILAATALTATPAAALQNEEPQQNDGTRDILNRILDRVLGPEEQGDPNAQADATTTTDTGTTALTIDSVLAADFRAEDRARDVYRHPSETLQFFRVQPGMRVAEFAPGGGWYSRVLAPYIGAAGRYYAVNFDSAGRELNAEQRQRIESWPRTFPTQLQQSTGVPASAVVAFESDEIPAGVEGTVDRILIFRNIHSMLNANVAGRELRNLRTLLADDGLVGVVQHRAPASETWERANGSRGYVRQADVVKLFEINGFELVQSSEINANRSDPANWERGVWTLPPTYALGDADRDRYTAIGESDRMTLLFRKAR
ncbi:MAG: class I SAM-dependent methyltransferase [Sphingomonadaceae bacterium]|nr:class I SAM-dependent methyltransferase [Sphingomonadaceae bacterium]